MTIYGVGYRSLQFEPQPVRERLQPIVSLEFRTLFRTRFGVALFLFCLLPSIVNLVVLLMQMGVLQFGGGMTGMLPERLRADHVMFYVDSIVADSFAPFLILSALVSSRAIAKDRAANALELYWTRGITPAGYMLAKFLGSFLLLCLMCVVAPVVLWVMGVLLAEDWTFLRNTIRFMPRVVAGLLAFTVLLGFLPVAFSALAGTANLASVMWCMLIVGTTGFARVLAELTEDAAWMPAVSLWDAAGTVARAIAGMPQPDGSVGNALLALFVAGGVLTALMVRRLRLREAIG